ncbi:hypothetical protein AB6A40_005738 [Gnathostoma spinigerum]|uniref:Uncharacterized protein n=1 Tax=Gnathostoma spinigerum TaxID=75299 RepID=A0ABD6ELK0_9BILA
MTDKEEKSGKVEKKINIEFPKKTEEEYYDDVRKELEEDADYESRVRENSKNFSNLLSGWSRGNITRLISLLKKSNLSEDDLTGLLQQLETRTKEPNVNFTLRSKEWVTPKVLRYKLRREKKTEGKIGTISGEDADLLQTREEAAIIQSTNIPLRNSSNHTDFETNNKLYGTAIDHRSTQLTFSTKVPRFSRTYPRRTMPPPQHSVEPEMVLNKLVETAVRGHPHPQYQPQHQHQLPYTSTVPTLANVHNPSAGSPLINALQTHQPVQQPYNSLQRPPDSGNSGRNPDSGSFNPYGKSFPNHPIAPPPPFFSSSVVLPSYGSQSTDTQSIYSHSQFIVPSVRHPLPSFPSSVITAPAPHIKQQPPSIALPTYQQHINAFPNQHLIVQPQQILPPYYSQQPLPQAIQPIPTANAHNTNPQMARVNVAPSQLSQQTTSPRIAHTNPKIVHRNIASSTISKRQSQPIVTTNSTLNSRVDPKSQPPTDPTLQPGFAHIRIKPLPSVTSHQSQPQFFLRSVDRRVFHNPTINFINNE